MKFSLLVLGLGAYIIASGSSYGVTPMSPTAPPVDTNPVIVSQPATNAAYDSSGIYKNLAPVGGDIAAVPPQPHVLASTYDPAAKGIFGAPLPRSPLGGLSYPYVYANVGDSSVGFTAATCESGLNPVVMGSLMEPIVLDTTCTPMVPMLSFKINKPKTGSGYNITANLVLKVTGGSNCKTVNGVPPAAYVDFIVWCQ